MGNFYKWRKKGIKTQKTGKIAVGLCRVNGVKKSTCHTQKRLCINMWIMWIITSREAVPQ